MTEMSLSLGQPKKEMDVSKDPATKETTPGGRQEIIWETVAKTSGLLQAQIMAGRLEAEGIPARAWQEGAGRALGLTVGLLGAGHVVVPDQFAGKARQILAEADDVFLDNFDEEE